MDYYCFPTKTGTTSVFSNLEQYSNSRERRFYESAQEDVRLANEKGKLLLFDLNLKTFVDYNGRLVDIRGKEIFPRCTIQESSELVKAIGRHGGNSIVTSYSTTIIENWFEYVDVKRNFLKTTFGELRENIDLYENKYGEKIFLKTIQKQFSQICYIMEMGKIKDVYAFMRGSMLGGNMLIADDSTPILLTNAISILVDENGTREWRVFVVKNKIWSISRMSDELVDVEEYVLERIQKKVEELSNDLTFPCSYCVDFMEYDSEGEIIFDICEFNPIQASGVFKNNKVVLV